MSFVLNDISKELRKTETDANDKENLECNHCKSESIVFDHGMEKNLW
jgi:hypothetical protein